MTLNTELPLPHAYVRLLNIGRATYQSGDVRRFALTWLAVAKLVSLGNLELESLRESAAPGGWDAVLRAELMNDTSGATLLKDLTFDPKRSAAAIDVISDLVRELPSGTWDVLPYLDLDMNRGEHYSGGVKFPLANFLFDLIGPNNGGESLWIPFDPNGILTILGLRRNWDVICAGPYGPSALLNLLLIIEFGTASQPRVNAQIVRSDAGIPTTHADVILAIPPFNTRGTTEARFAQWDSTGGASLEMYDRGDLWFMQELLRRAKRQAIFVSTPALLFAKGQEKRLREHFLNQGGEQNEVSQIFSMPPGLLAETNVGCSVVVINPHQHAHEIRIFDLSSAKVLPHLDDLIGLNSQAAQSGQAKAGRVTRDEIFANESSFAPARYLHRIASMTEHAQHLAEFCAVIRPPAYKKQLSEPTAKEVGITDLTSWCEIEGPFDKVAHVGATISTYALRKGDVILSLKGTVGKAGLLGAVADTQALVCSQSCVALRIVSPQAAKLISPIFLLMYLRSRDGQAQMQSLTVGATISHLSPASLLSSLLIPVPTAKDLRDIEAEYREICELEQRAEQCRTQITEIASRRWNATYMDR